MCRVTPEGHPSLKDGEVSQFLWWNPNHDLKNIPVETHVAEILGKVDWPD